MSQDRIGISRRQVLAGLGTVGVASAGAGVGTSALFSDTESFDDNSIAAGTLDLKVDWEEHYSYPQALGFDDPTVDSSGEPLDVVRSEPEDASAYVGLPDPQSPMVWVHESDLTTYMENTSIESFPDTDDDGVQDLTDGDWSYDACRDGADVDEHFDPSVEGALRTNNADTYDEGADDPVQPLVNLDDVKPGDFGELTLSFHLCDNPGYVWLQGMNVSESEGGLTEPEEAAGDDETAGELADQIRTVWWYDSRGDNVLQTDCEERLYLADSGTDPTTLFEVTLNDNTGEAELTELLGPGEYSDGDFDQTDAIAATPNGDAVLFYDKESGHLGTYDIEGDTFTDEGAITGDPGGVVLAGYAPDGTLWAASQQTDELYTVDISTSPPTATSQGDTGIDLSGADLVFSSDGTMYIWTANTDEDGLYRVDDPSSDPTAVPVDASNVGEKNERITGLAIRDAGTGDLVASERESNEVVVVDRTDGSITDSYAMTLNGEPYDYDFGDMTSGTICGEVFRRGTLGEDLAELESGGGIPLDGNRASPFDELGDPADSENRECFVPGVTHYVGFAWWLPTNVGNEVQSDSVQFDLGFYAEQCRHSDGSYSNDS